MKMMLKWRYNRLKYLVKLSINKQIKHSEYVTESETLRNEIYILESMR